MGGAHRFYVRPLKLWARSAQPTLPRSPLLHQRILRRRQRQEFLRVAAAVRMGGLGGALVGAVDFRRREAAAERQCQQLAMALLRRKRVRRDVAESETSGIERARYVGPDFRT